MNAMEALARQSQAAIELFSDEWFRLTQDLHRDAPVRYLIVTVEKLSGVVYAPVSNLSRALLGAFSTQYAEGDLIEKIRHQYLLPRALEGPIRDLWAAARTDPTVLPPHYLLARAIRLDENEEAGALAVCDPSGKDDVSRAKGLLSRFAAQLRQTSSWMAQPSLPRLLKASSDQDGATLYPFLLLRLESSFSESASSRTQGLDLVQLGLALSPAQQLPPESVGVCLSACRTSGLAAFSVLYEKERYYERAARQCVTTSAVKYGPRTEIKEQAEVLDILHESGAFNIPVLDKTKSDTALWEEGRAGDVSWYRMPWLDLRSLADTLLWKGGSRDFEIAALMRATVSHLRQVHWRNAELGTDEHPREAMFGALLLAKRAAEGFYRVARDVVKRVENESPIFGSSAVRFYRREQLDCVNRLLKIKAEGPGRLQFSLRWHDENYWRGDVGLPELNLMKLCKAVARTSLAGPCRALQARFVHADAHFGNLLVDASVPEDPLIISIDPKPLRPASGEDFSAEATSLRIEMSHLDLGLRNLKFDPLYDLSKCVMSTSGLHGPIIRGALELHSSNQTGFTLTNPPDGVRHLTDTGGMSSSGLIRVGTQVRKDCLADHATCSGSLLRELQGALSADSGRPGTDAESRLGINVGLVRLWGLSLRALFSAAADRFPSDMATGVALFVLASAYAEVGTKQFAEVLGKGSLREASAADLEGPFRWYRP